MSAVGDARRPWGAGATVTAVVAVAMAMAGSRPAVAAEAPFVEFGFAAGAVNPGQLSGRAAMPSGLSVVTRVQLTAASLVAPGDSASTTVCDPCESGSEARFSWATPELAHNGPYRLTVRAWGTEALDLDGAEQTTASRTYALSLPAQRPSDPVAVTQTDRTVEVTWAKVTAHPDLVGYEVRRRAPDGSAFLTAGHAQQPSGATVRFVDSAPSQSAGAGVYEYEIRTIRAGSVPDDPHTAVFSSAAAASAVVPAPPTSTTPPTTPTGEPADPGGEDTPAGPGGPTTTGETGPDLGDFLSRASGGAATRPAPTPSGPRATIPDTFDETLPFTTSTSVPLATLGEEGSGRPAQIGDSTESALGELGAESNRRALLVPVAAGSILCLMAFHLRVLLRSHGTPAFAGAPAPAPAESRRRRRKGRKGRGSARPSPEPLPEGVPEPAADGAAVVPAVPIVLDRDDAPDDGGGDDAERAAHLFEEYGPQAGWSEQEGPSGDWTDEYGVAPSVSAEEWTARDDEFDDGFDDEDGEEYEAYDDGDEYGAYDDEYEAYEDDDDLEDGEDDDAVRVRGPAPVA